MKASPSISDPSLETVQRWMLSVMTHPGGIIAGLESSAARQAMDVSPEHLDQVISPSLRCTSEERLAVYANAYFARLVECLEAEFPTVRQAVGAEAFQGFAQGYLQAYPSTSYTLNMLGQGFPAYLASSRPVDEQTGLASWSDFIVELARLERLYAEVFDGPGEESLPTFSADVLRTVSPERWGELQLVPSPSLRLCRFQFPVHEAISGARQGKPVLPESPRETWLVVSRRDYIVRREAVSELQWRLLHGFQAGQKMEEAIELALEYSMASLEELAQGLQNWFQHWAAAGYFREIIVASRPAPAE